MMAAPLPNLDNTPYQRAYTTVGSLLEVPLKVPKAKRPPCTVATRKPNE